MFWERVHARKGKPGENGGELSNKPTCHCLDRNATTRGERGVRVGQDGGWRRRR